MSDATPRPWYAMYFDESVATVPHWCVCEDTVLIVADEHYGYGHDGEAAANAALIVRAVNSHDALVAACRMVLDDPGLTAAANDVIRSALAAAEG